MADFKINGKTVITQSGIDEPVLASNVALLGGTQLSHRNLYINGAMTVDQRGTATGTASSKYGPDRWNTFNSSGGTWEQSQSTESPAGFANSFKMKCTVANASLGAGNYVMVAQKIEAQNLQHLDWGTASPKEMTLSFWVRSAIAGTHICQLHHPTPATTEYNSIAYTVNVADTWEYKTMTWLGDTGTALLNDEHEGFRIYFWLSAGSNYTSGTLTPNTFHTNTDERAPGQQNLADTVNNEFYLTGIQMEVGSKATPFEHRSYADVLQSCERYYEVIYDASEALPPGEVIVGVGVFWKVDQLQVSAPFRTKKRWTPTLFVTTGSNYFKADRFSSEKLISGAGTGANQNDRHRWNMWMSGSGFSDSEGNVWEWRTNNAAAKAAFDCEI